MNQNSEKVDKKFLNIITDLLGHTPSKEEMQKILEPLNTLGEDARHVILNILEDISLEQDETARIKKMEKFVTALKTAKKDSL
jgi:hypothetical protein